MKDDTRWKLIAGVLLVTLTLAMLTTHYLVFQDAHHLFIFLIGDLAFIPIEVLVITLIIDQMLESREKKSRLEKLNMVIGVFFSRFGTPLLEQLTRTDPTIEKVKQRLVIGDEWRNDMFRDVQTFLNSYSCSITIERVDKAALREYPYQPGGLFTQACRKPGHF